ncbi:MAG: hypothetical protein Q9224_005774 [Gallowayella concinna]
MFVKLTCLQAITASIITIVGSAGTLILQIEEIIQNIRQHEENARSLSEKLDTLKGYLDQAAHLYRPEANPPYSERDHQIRQATRSVIVCCEHDLRKYKTKLNELVRHANWAAVAWRQRRLAPALENIGRSISEHRQHLQMLVQLLQGSVTTPGLQNFHVRPADLLARNQINRMQEMILELLRMLRRASTDNMPPSPTASDEFTDADSSLQRVNRILDGEVDLREGQPGMDSNPNGTLDGREEDHASHEVLERNSNGKSLLKAIHKGDNNEAESLLQNSSTSLQVVDRDNRTPLLLAAHLGKVKLVKMLLENLSQTTPQSHNNANDSNITSHREVDLDATDSLGRTVLHYCAEFGMCDQARMLLDHGVKVNPRDGSDYPPLYYAIKHRKCNAVETMLIRGATTGFAWPTTSYSYKIKILLEKASKNSDPTVISAHST